MPDFFTKAIEVLKIPLKVLLPALWIFSGFMLFSSDDFLEKINLFEWSNQNGFVFGLLFLISTCLILVYVFWFIKEKLSTFWFNITLNRRMVRLLENLNDAEKSIIIRLFKSPNYTNYFDYSQPVVQSLLARKLIYMGNNQPISLGWNNEMMAKFTLQPATYKAMKYLVDSLYDGASKLEKKISNTTNLSKKTRLTNELNEIKDTIKNYEQYEVQNG